MKLTRHQRLVIGTEGVTLLGVDEAGRPVVEQQRMFSDHVDRWALTKTGDPTDVRGDVVSTTCASRLNWDGHPFGRVPCDLGGHHNRHHFKWHDGEEWHEIYWTDADAAREESPTEQRQPKPMLRQLTDTRRERDEARAALDRVLKVVDNLDAHRWDWPNAGRNADAIRAAVTGKEES